MADSLLDARTCQLLRGEIQVRRLASSRAWSGLARPCAGDSNQQHVQLHLAAQALKAASGMHLNSTHLVRGDRRTLLEKAHIWEADLPSPVRRAPAAAQPAWGAARHAAVSSSQACRSLTGSRQLQE